MDRYDRLAKCIEEMADYACETQHEVVRTYKDDGSVLTNTDLYISSTICDVIRTLFPEANIVTEESLNEFDDHAEMTFVLDPIDGTDVYSQGSPAWCISLGILDRNHKCVGAMVNAPRFGLSRDQGLFFRQDPGKRVLLNGQIFKVDTDKDEPRQIAMGSNSPRHLDFSCFRGKIRCYGSNILHMVSILIHSHIQGAIAVPCFAWDMVGAHALLEACGFAVRYADGRQFAYDHRLLVERKPFKGIVICGTEKGIESIAKMLPPLECD